MDKEQSTLYIPHKREVTTAIMVDGGFYRKRAFYHWGDKDPKARADELFDFCMSLLRDKHEQRNLYRIFYYDCPPVSKMVYNPITKKSDNLEKSAEYTWTNKFFQELRHRRKMALRLGRLSDNALQYNLKYDSFKKLINGSISLNELTQNDIELNIEQKGVDMRIGIDISSLAIKRQVDQIILISGDSDFVPAAKHARREGIDFILVPMGATIKPDLHEHIDGMINRPTKLLYNSDDKEDKNT
ncbi:MAG: NYN domain-containing protein [Ruminococcus sp.]|nr:NYN domain-containing protein [Ruminococcus sp.]